MKTPAHWLSLLFLILFAGYVEDLNLYGEHQYLGKPTLPALLKFPPSCPKSDCISIPLKIGQKYWHFGILLLQDNTGNMVETIEYESQKNAEMINLKILKKWINGIGLPVTWDILIQVLHDIELHQLASEIYDAVYACI